MKTLCFGYTKSKKTFTIIVIINWSNNIFNVIFEQNNIFVYSLRVQVR